MSNYGGRITEPDKGGILKEYTEFVIKKSGIKRRDARGFRVKAGGKRTVGAEINLLFDNLGIKNRDSGFDIAFSFDGDADRLAVFDKAGNRISPDYVLGLLAKDGIGFISKPRVVYDLRFSRGVLEKFKEWGIRSFQSRVGRTFIREEMIKRGAGLGGELSGHLLFKKNDCFESPLLAMLEILKITARTGESINQLVEEFKTWFNSGEMNIESGFKDSKFKDLAESLKEKYKDGKIDELDGVTVEYPDWWFNLRSSHTEPVLRLVVEAKTKNLLNEKVGEITKIVKV
jgi:phosphomannomutase